MLALGALGVLLGAAVSRPRRFFVNLGMDAQGANALSRSDRRRDRRDHRLGLRQARHRQLKAENLWLERTAHSVSRDAGVLKEKVNG